MKLILKDNQRALVIASSLIPSGKIPDEIMIVPFGKWKNAKTTGGEKVEFEITPDIARSAVEYHNNFERRFPTRDLPIDYEHQTLTGGEAPAAGWYRGLFIKENGIFANVKKWTDKAKEYLLNGEYRYHSPVLCFNDVDGETGDHIPLWISSIGLTNSPFLNSIQPVIAKNGNATTIIYLTNSQTNKGDTTMLEQILQLLNLAAGATFDDVKKVIEGFKNSASSVAAKYKAAMTELGLKDDASTDDIKTFALKQKSIFTELGLKSDVSVDDAKQYALKVKELFTGLGIQSTAELADIKKVIASKNGNGSTDSATVIELKNNVITLTTQLNERDAKEIIAKHVQRGAVAPFEVDDLTNDVKGGKLALKDLNDRLAKRADYSIVPLKEIDAKRSAPASSGISNETLEIAAKMNVSKEDIEKYGK